MKELREKCKNIEEDDGYALTTGVASSLSLYRKILKKEKRYLELREEVGRDLAKRNFVKERLIHLFRERFSPRTSFRYESVAMTYFGILEEGWEEDNTLKEIFFSALEECLRIKKDENTEIGVMVRWYLKAIKRKIQEVEFNKAKFLLSLDLHQLSFFARKDENIDENYIKNLLKNFLKENKVQVSVRKAGSSEKNQFEIDLNFD